MQKPKVRRDWTSHRLACGGGSVTLGIYVGGRYKILTVGRKSRRAASHSQTSCIRVGLGFDTQGNQHQVCQFQISRHSCFLHRKTQSHNCKLAFIRVSPQRVPAAWALDACHSQPGFRMPPKFTNCLLYIEVFRAG